jgi:hypothetical protein
MNGLIAENKWAWFIKQIHTLFKARYKPYPVYKDPEVNNGIFKIKKPTGAPVTIALLSDWASDTPESQLIARQVGINDYSIHLGDTYYVGNDQEIAENFNTGHGGTWPYGTLGSFAMLGNHEMYSSGQSYFTQLLPYMGAYQKNQKKPVQVQRAGFFCLENDHWRIIGLDTGYDSLAGLFGFFQNKNLDLTPEQKDWLQNTVNINGDNRGIIFLTHHQPWSAFQEEFPKPAAFLSSIIVAGRDFLWFWGHEHWLAIYGPNKLPNGSNVYGRCIGNSGMPVELKVGGKIVQPKKQNDKANPANRHLIIYDRRHREVIDNNIPLGHNGYEILTLDGASLVVTYFDENNGNSKGRRILEEKWTIDIATGKLKGNSIKDYITKTGHPDKLNLSLFGDKLEDAI